MARRRYYYEYYDDYRGLARDPIDGKVGGVCAGIARYLGVSTFSVRLVTVIGLLACPGFTLTAYAIAYFILDARP